MYPLSPSERRKMEQRKTHKMLKGFETGSLAELEEDLRKRKT